MRAVVAALLLIAGVSLLRTAGSYDVDAGMCAAQLVGGVLSGLAVIVIGDAVTARNKH